MLIEIAGRLLLIDSRDEWSAMAVSAVLGVLALPVGPENGRTPDCTIRIRRAEPPQIPVELEGFDVPDGICHTNGKTLYLELDGSLVVIGTTGEQDIEVWIRKQYDLSSWILAQLISQALAAAMRRCGLFLLHGAGVRPPQEDKAILIAGNSGTGKSTITFQLASWGWGYLSDDVLLFNELDNGIEVRGLRRFFALTADTMAAVQFLPKAELAGMGKLKRRIAPEDLFPLGQIQSAAPGAVIFPRITDDARSRIRRLSIYESMMRLLRLDPWSCYDKPTARDHLNFFGRLARETVGFELSAGKDLLGNPGLTAEMVASVFKPVK